jgi:hypothetical protein
MKKKKRYLVEYPTMGIATYFVYATSAKEALEIDPPDDIDHEWEMTQTCYPAVATESLEENNE